MTKNCNAFEGLCDKYGLIWQIWRNAQDCSFVLRGSIPPTVRDLCQSFFPPRRCNFLSLRFRQYAGRRLIPTHVQTVFD